MHACTVRPPPKKRKAMPINIKHAAVIVGFGQLLSLLVASSQLFNSGLNLAANASTPTGFYLSFTQLALHYLLLFLVFGVLHVVKRKNNDPNWSVANWRNVWHIYLAFGVFDFYANYAVTKAFAYTSPLSAFLLNQSSTPFTVLISMVVFRARYSALHLAALLIAIGGLAIIVWQDLTATSRLSTDVTDSSTVALGNFLGLISGLGFALANTTQEWAVKRLGGPNELCLFVGFFGTLVSCVHMSIFERQEISDLVGMSSDVVPSFAGNLIGFLVAMFTLYSVGPYFFRMASATLFNVSLLTSGFFVLLGTVVIMKSSSITAWYFGGFMLMVVGLFVFNFDPKGWKDVFMADQAGAQVGEEDKKDEESTLVGASGYGATSSSSTTDVVSGKQAATAEAAARSD
ncbi:solute carrier family 35 member SLC35F1/F2/F6 [Catenaria anguillulae PL171]|uniref:Solute carrier family 35 member SLC35F1/F2/F6 n=1 Tax=Catenaria anguillulae PL171 TaxID=765915 RepID=A0A1Y2H8K0_9FUNG|nr:solute carrier family 35 member SLC35F1/F2/F6 [Catenaria anguillulae PL171]